MVPILSFLFSPSPSRKNKSLVTTMAKLWIINIHVSLIWMPPRVSLTAGGERDSLSLSTRAWATETALAPAETLGKATERWLPGEIWARSLHEELLGSRFRSFWAATREPRGRAWPWNTAGDRAWGVLERKKGAEGDRVRNAASSLQVTHRHKA